jgi:hypothetical protein
VSDFTWTSGPSEGETKRNDFTFTPSDIPEPDENGFAWSPAPQSQKQVTQPVTKPPINLTGFTFRTATQEQISADARANLLKVSPDPLDTSNALDAAEMQTIFPPAFAAGDPSGVLLGLYGETNQKPGTTLKDKFVTWAQAWLNQQQVNQLRTHRSGLGGPGKDPSLDAQIDNLEKSQVTPEQAVGLVPSVLLGTFAGLLYQGYMVGKEVANYTMAALTLEPIRYMLSPSGMREQTEANLNLLRVFYGGDSKEFALASDAIKKALEPSISRFPEAETPFTNEGRNAQDAVLGSFMGASLQVGEQLGLDNNTNVGIAWGVAGLQAISTGFRIKALEGALAPATKELAPVITPSLSEAINRATAKVALGGVADSVIRIASNGGIQGAYGAVQAGIQVVSDELMKIVSGKTMEEMNQIVLQATTEAVGEGGFNQDIFVDGLRKGFGEWAWEKVKEAGTILGLGFVSGVGMGLGASGIGETVHIVRDGFLDRQTRAIADTIEEQVGRVEPAPKPVEPVVELKMKDLLTDEPLAIPEVTKPIPDGVAPKPDSGIPPTPREKEIIQTKIVEEPPPTITEPVPIAEELPGRPPFRTEEVPVSQIMDHPQITNFKEKITPLEGAYERAGTAPIVLLETRDGSMFVVTGRHRLAHMRETGGETIPAQIFREADGFTIDMARVFDAEANIRDGQGTVRDYAKYFRETGVTAEQAQARGLLSRSAGKNGFDLGTNAVDEVYTGYRNHIITEEQAAGIARGAPRDPVVQQEAMVEAIQKKLSGDELEILSGLLLQKKGENIRSGQPELFEVTVEYKKGLTDEIRIATNQQNKLKAEISILKKAGRISDPEVAKTLEDYGFKPGDVEQINAKISELQTELQRWQNWVTDPQLHDTIREMAGLPRQERPSAEIKPEVAEIKAPEVREPEGPSPYLESIKAKAAAAKKIKARTEIEYSDLSKARELTGEAQKKILDQYGIETKNLSDRLTELERLVKLWEEGGWVTNRELAALVEKELRENPTVETPKPTEPPKPPKESPKPVEAAGEPEQQSVADYFLKTATGQREMMLEALTSAQKEANLLIKVVDKQERARVKARDSVRKMVKDLNTVMGELDKAKIPNEFKDNIRALWENFTTTKPRTKTLERLTEIKKAIEDGTAPTDFPKRDLARLDDIAKTPFRELSTADQKTLHDAIMAYYKAGMESKVIHDRDLSIQAAEAADIATSDLKQLKIFKDLKTFMEEHPQLSADEARAAFAQIKKPNFIKNLLRWYKSSNMGYESMILLLGGKEDSLVYRVAGKAIDAGEDVHASKVYEYMDPILGWIKDKKLNFSDFLNERREIDVEGFSGEIERGQVIAMAGLKATEDGWASLIDGGFVRTNDREYGKVYHLSESTLNKILGTMDDMDREFLQHIFDLGKKTGADMGQVFKSMYGYDLKLLDPYYPIYRYMPKEGVPIEDEIVRQRDSSSFIHPGVDKSHTIERVGSTKTVVLRNVGEDLIDTVESAARFVGLGEPIRNAARLLFNEKYSTAIIQRYGKEFYNELTAGFRYIAGHKTPLNAIDKFVANILNRGVGAVLGFSPNTVAINRLLDQRSLAYVPVRDWTKAGAYTAAHPISTHKYLIDKSVLYRQISEAGTMTEVRAVVTARKPRGKTARALSTVQKASMAPIRWANAEAAKREMWGAILQAQRELKAGKPSTHLQRAADLSDRDGPNMTYEQREDAAVKYAEYVQKRIHAAPREMYQGNLTRQGILGKIFSTLMSDRNAVLQLGIRLAVDMKTPGGGKKFVKYLLTSVLGESLGTVAIRAGTAAAGTAIIAAVTGKREKPKSKNLLVDSLNELIQNVVGSAYGLSGAAYSVRRALAAKSDFTISADTSLINQFETDMLKMLNALKQGLVGETKRERNKGWWDAFESFMAFAVPLFTRVPYKHGLGDILDAYRKSTGQ